jgi:Tfp pilus assembly protein PilF
MGLLCRPVAEPPWDRAGRKALQHFGLRSSVVFRRYTRTFAAGAVVVLVAIVALSAYYYHRYQVISARSDIEAEDYANARTHIHAALAFWPWDSDGLLLAAKIARFDGDRLEAENALSEFKRLNGGPSEAMQIEQLLLRVENGELEEVGPQLDYAIDHDHPLKLDMLEAIVRGSVPLMRYQRARMALDHWLALDPDCVRALDWRSWVNERLTFFDKSASDAERALQLQPHRTKLRERLIALYLTKKDTADATPHAEFLVQADANSANGLVALAQCRLLQGQTNQGQELLERALAISPNHPTGTLELARIYNRQGRADEAEVVARHGLETAPDDSELLFALLESFRLQEKSDAETARWRDHYQRVKADSDLVTDFLKQESETGAWTADRAVQVGTAFLRLHNEQLGVIWLFNALKKDPINRPARLLLAQHYEEKGKLALANQYRQAVGGFRETIGGAVGCSIAASPWGH